MLQGKCTYLAVLEVLEKDVQPLALLAVVLHNNARAPNDLARVALAVDLAETRPGAEFFCVGDLDEVDAVLSAESLDELEVLLLRVVLVEDAQMRLPPVERLRALTETTRKPIVN